jgi:hypothetical protein
VVEVLDGSDVVCVARNDALLDGLLTVFHVERSSDELLNLQNDLPLLSDYDKECIISLAVVSADLYELLCSADVCLFVLVRLWGLKVTIVCGGWGGGGDERLGLSMVAQLLRGTGATCRTTCRCCLTMTRSATSHWQW